MLFLALSHVINIADRQWRTDRRHAPPTTERRSRRRAAASGRRKRCDTVRRGLPLAVAVLGAAALSAHASSPVLPDGDPGGSASTTGTTNVAAAPGYPYSWEAAISGVKTSNGNKQTVIPLFSWTARGGMKIAFNLYNNTEGFSKYFGDSTDFYAGRCWRHSYDSYMLLDNSGNVTIWWDNGQVVTYHKNSDGSYTAPTGIHDTLTKVDANTYDYTTTDQYRYRFIYKSNGNDGAWGLTYIWDRNNNQITINRTSGTPDGVTSIVDPTGRTINLSYGAISLPNNLKSVYNNYLQSVTDPLGRTWDLTLSLNYSKTLINGVVHVTSDNDATLSSISWPAMNGQNPYYGFTYSTADEMLSERDRNGNITSWTYNSDGTINSATDACGNTVKYAYSSSSNGAGTTTITDPNNHNTVFTYTNGLLTSVTDAESLPESYQYDANNNMVAKTDRRQHIWKFGYDASGTNETGVTDPDSHTTSYTYNSRNDPLTITDPLTHLTSFGYDSFGNLSSITDGMNHTWTRTVPSGNGGLPTAIGDPNSPSDVTKLDQYDGNGDLTHTTDPNGLGSGTALYNALGQLTQFTAINGTVTGYSYDNWGRLTQVTVTPPSGSGLNTATTTYGYDWNDNLLTVTDPNNHTVTRTYDACNRVLTVTNGRGDKVIYIYDGTYNSATQKGLLSSVKNGNGIVTSYEYTPRNELAATHYADGTTYAVAYDGNGNLIGRTDRMGIYSTFGYDNENRLIQVNHPGTAYGGTNPTFYAGFTFGYDAAGHRTSMTDVTGTTTWSYDAAGRTTYYATPIGNVSYGYDNANRLTSYMLNEGGSSGIYNLFNFNYDAGGRLTSRNDWTGSSLTYSYNNLDQVSGTVAGNGVHTYYNYDAFGRVGDIYTNNNGGTRLNWEHFVWDGVGNLSARTDAAGEWTAFYYDGANQLVNEQKTPQSPGATPAGAPIPPPYQIAYSYDNNGNRISRTYYPNYNGSPVTDTYTVDQNTDRLMQVSFGSGGYKSFRYDADGDLLDVYLNGTLTQDFSWDYENRLVSLNPHNSSLTSSWFSYSYNALGQRQTATDSQGSRSFVYDGATPGSNLLIDGRAIYTAGISEWRGNKQGQGQIYYYGTDPQGSVTLVTDPNQNTVAGNAYDAFGNTVAGSTNTGPFFGNGGVSGDQGLWFGYTPTPMGYVAAGSYQNDFDTGYMYVGNRYYDSSTGRFLSVDPAQSGSNWYAYCGNNPATMTDPTGLFYTGSSLKNGYGTPTPHKGDPIAGALANGIFAGDDYATSLFSSLETDHVASAAANKPMWGSSQGDHFVSQTSLDSIDVGYSGLLGFIVMFNFSTSTAFQSAPLNLGLTTGDPLLQGFFSGIKDPKFPKVKTPKGFSHIGTGSPVASPLPLPAITEHALGKLNINNQAKTATPPGLAPQ